MSAAGTPKASEAAIAAVQEAMRSHYAVGLVEGARAICICGWDRRDEVGSVLGGLFAEHVARAAADAAAPWIAAQALQDAAEETITHRSWLRDRADQIEEGHDPR